jgi:hypothetical protein
MMLAARTLLHQAQNAAYVDSFSFATLNFALMLPLLLLVRPPAKGEAQSAPVVAD